MSTKALCPRATILRGASAQALVVAEANHANASVQIGTFIAPSMLFFDPRYEGNLPGRRMCVCEAVIISVAFLPMLRCGPHPGSEVVKLLETVRRNPFLSMLTEAELEKLLAQAGTRHFAKGKAVYRKGDPASGFFVVFSGHVATSLEAVDGNHRPLRVYDPGEVLGEISMLEGKPRITGALALEDASLKFVRRRDFDALLTGRPGLAVHIVGYLCARFRRLHSDFDAMITLDVPSKLARVILHLDQKFSVLDDKLKLPSLRLSQGEIAAMLGLSREWIGQELIRWRDAGIVELSRKRLIIRDRSALERILNHGCLDQ